MLRDKIKSTNLKLYILLLLIVSVFIIFGIYFTRDYVRYYLDLYSYRQRLIESLQDQRTEKPFFNNNDPYKGNPRAKIVIFEYSDFSCGACKALQPVLKEVENFYGANNIFHVFKDVPVTVGPDAKLAHIAARCAQEQNAFFEYHDELYKQQGRFNENLFLELASKLKLNETIFSECLKNKRHEDLIDNNLREALRLGIDATPTLFINNQEVVSGFNFNNIRSIIERTK